MCRSDGATGRDRGGHSRASSHLAVRRRFRHFEFGQPCHSRSGGARTPECHLGAGGGARLPGRDPAGVGPRIFLQQVPEPKAAKNRLHLDIRVSRNRGADEWWAEAVRKGWITPARIRGQGPPPRGKPVMTLQELLQELDRDREDR